MTDKKETIISLLRSTARPGMEAVIARLEPIGYFRAGCRGHHRYCGGMSDHALEVLEYMTGHAPEGTPRESLIISALFHDLGKAVRRGGRYHFDHPARSLAVLDECGLELTRDERTAIGCHHRRNPRHRSCALRNLLHSGDCWSTGRWKEAHPYGF